MKGVVYPTEYFDLTWDSDEPDFILSDEDEDEDPELRSSTEPGSAKPGRRLIEDVPLRDTDGLNGDETKRAMLEKSSLEESIQGLGA